MIKKYTGEERYKLVKNRYLEFKEDGFLFKMKNLVIMFIKL